MKSYIDIENSKTRKVNTIIVPLIRCDLKKEVLFDISNITEKEMKMLMDAINPNLDYTDIEIFYLESEPGTPNFGPDYEFKIIDGVLHAIYTRDKWLSNQ